MSIPATMRALYGRLEEMISSPVFSRRLATTEAKNDHLAPKMDTNEEPATVSQSAAVPEDDVSNSACGAKSEHPSERKKLLS